MFFCTLTSLAQGEANFWYFGENAGLNFNDCTPQAITDGELNTIEGCSTFSDPDGNLLFYSDGSTVWNRNHQVMPNGQNMLGNASSSQSAMIIPKPGSSNIYYIFTVGAETITEGGEYGFNYYVIDMEAEAGLGDVIEGPYDLSQGRAHDWTEKVAAVKGAQSGTFWVVSYVPNEFVAYKITSDGVASTPIKSSAYGASDRRGYLKLSPDGTKLAVAHQADSAFLLYNFNSETGKVTNELNLPLITEGNKPYGVEFSANSEKLYVHASNDAFNALSDENPTDPTHISTLFQFDTSLGSNSAIVNSRTIIHEGNLFRGSLQLGPDRRIYRSLAKSYTEGIPQLGVIENPEEDGTDCNYNHASIGLLGRNSTQGLPPFIASIFLQVQVIAENSSGQQTQINDGEVVNVCQGDDISIYSNELEGFSRFTWYFNGNPTPISMDPVLNFTNISAADNGTYTLSIYHTDICGNIITLESQFTIDVQDYPTVLSPVVLSNCDEDGVADGFTNFNLEEINDIITIGNSNLLISYHLTYHDADNQLNAIDQSSFNNSIANVVYARVKNAAGCHAVATVNLEVSTTAFPTSYSGEILQSCDNDDISDGLTTFDLSGMESLFLSQFPPNPNLSVHYYRNSSDAHLEVNEIPQNVPYMSETPYTQTLYVRVENDLDEACFGIGPYLTLNVFPRPEFEVEPEIIMCTNLTSFTTISAFNPQGIYSYLWTGPNGFTSNNPTTTVTEGGIYTVVASSVAPNGDICESFPKTVNVIESSVAQIDYDDVLITDDTANNTITILRDNLGPGDYEFALDYEFGPYQDSSIFEDVSIGIHTIYVNDKNGCGLTSLEVSVIGFPKFFTPNNDGFNDTWRILGVNDRFYSASTLQIFNRFGKILAIIKPSDQGWDGNYNGYKLPEADYWYKAEIIDDQGNIRNKKGHFSLIRRKR